MTTKKENAKKRQYNTTAIEAGKAVTNIGLLRHIVGWSGYDKYYQRGARIALQSVDKPSKQPIQDF